MASDRLTQLLVFHESNPSDSFVSFALAKEFEKRGDDEKALHYYTQIVVNHPDYTGVYYHLGKLYERRNQFQAAYFTYKKGMEVARQQNDQHSLNELAGAKLSLGDEEDLEAQVR
jgi:tetratricopeptide (TPR) repeat protein